MSEIKRSKHRDKFIIPFTSLKNMVLGKKFSLSLVFTDEVFSRNLNKIYRGYDKPANVLGFLLSRQSGEIFIDLVTARKEKRKFGMTFPKFVEFLFIHALLHLKGMEHGDTMEKTELKLLNGSPNRKRNRYRDF